MSTQPSQPKSSKKPVASRRATLVRYYNPAYLHEVTIRTNRGAFGFDPVARHEIRTTERPPRHK